MRCLTLADALRALGATCSFICRTHPGNLLHAIEKRGYETTALQAGEDCEAGALADGALAHAAWLGADWQTDARQTLAAIGERQAAWLVVDHYAIDARWESAVRPACHALMAIDDLADRTHDCELLLDQNWYGASTPARYDRLVPETCEKRLGPRHALLRPEYALLREWMPAHDGIVRRLLIFLGGSDPTNETAKVLDVLDHPAFDVLAADVVLGPNHPDPDGIARRVAGRPATSFHQGLPSLAGMMARADLMIGAGGSTSWERMCLGLPAIVISIADNQTPTNLALMEEGYIDFLGEMGDVTVAHIAAALKRAMANPDALQLQSRKMQQLVSGTGAGEIAATLLNRTLHNRPCH